MFLFYPLSDDNPTPRKPILTWTIIGINVLVFLYQMSLGDAANNRLVSDYGVRPSVFTDFNDLHTIVTSAFLHGGFAHLFSNMLFLYIFFFQDDFFHFYYSNGCTKVEINAIVFVPN